MIEAIEVTDRLTNPPTADIRLYKYVKLPTMPTSKQAVYIRGVFRILNGVAGAIFFFFAHPAK